MEAKKIAAEKAVEAIKHGMVVGLGTGSTASYAIHKIGQRVKQGLNIQAVATSVRSENLARELGIPICAFDNLEHIDITIDGADEVDRFKNLTKGGGGSLLREKVVAFNSKIFYVIVDDSKLTDTLAKFPLPVEIIPFAAELTLKHLQTLGCQPQIRKNGDRNFITDNGNLIADCKFDLINDPSALNTLIKAIPGVVESGLFLNNMVTAIYVGRQNGTVEVL